MSNGKYTYVFEGQRFGNLTAIKNTGKKWNYYPLWECLCDCGRKTQSSSYYLLKGKSKSCGINGHLLNLTGKKFNKLLVIEKAANKGNFSAWLCKCDCGNNFIAETRGLIHNRTKNCGCGKHLHLEGKKFGYLTVLKEINQNGVIKWECLCDCGNIVHPTTGRLTGNKANSCGICTRKIKESPTNKYAKDITGRRVGNLVVLYQSKKISTQYGMVAYWRCKCDCGKEVDILRNCLIMESTKSCGCRRLNFKDRTIPAKRKIFREYKSRSKKKNLEFNLTFEDFLHLLEQNCYYCNSKPNNKSEGPEGDNITRFSYTYSGIDRKDNNIGYIIDNVVPCCKICNYAKIDMSFNDFIKWIKLLGSNLELKNYGE